MILTMESIVFKKLLVGEADFGALIGRSKASDVRPINLEFSDPTKMLEAWEKAKPFMNFFSPRLVKSKTLSPEYAGEGHGAHPIPLVYWDGLRSSWYYVPQGTVLNEAEEAAPYP